MAEICGSNSLKSNVGRNESTPIKSTFINKPSAPEDGYLYVKHFFALIATNDELACVYGALILQDDEITIIADKINTVSKVADVCVEPYWSGLFTKTLEGVDLKQLITNVGSGAGVAPTG
ncbi:large ribosomal subunit protein P1-like [Tachypleus tridentatus]|uniref:large ribosomal subunit protein P1-like n=1 Tax=Tachypleus tridentatus TaxID=6853 RepID=UPI003FD3591C